tara:strand:- start:63 stop:1730 length:1668 start_codon:yes stop_codon:yes gene_type:complete
MDLTTLKAVVFELSQDIIPSRFEKAQQYDSNTIQLGFRTLKGIIWLEISWVAECPRIVQIESPKREGDKSTLAKQIQHILYNLALVEIKQSGFERIVRFKFASRPGNEIEKEIIVELMGRHSNFLLLDKKKKIITLGKQVKQSQSRLRPIGTGDIYTLPPSLKGQEPTLDETFNSWKKSICLVPSTFKNSLMNSYKGISPSIILQIADNDHNEALRISRQSVTKIESKTWIDIFERWKEWLLDIEKNNFNINFTGPTDFVVWGKKKSESKNICLSLGSYYSHKLLERKFNIIKNQITLHLKNSKKDEIKKLESQIQLIESISEYKNMQNKANKILASEKPSKKDIIEAQNLFKKAKRKKRSSESILNRIEFHKKKISDIECSELFLNSLIGEEANDQKKKLNRIIELKEEIEEYIICKVKNNPKFKSKIQKRKSSPVKEIKSPNGIRIQIGRNHRQNELISLKKGTKGDLWFHAQETPGSHIVLKSSHGFIDDKDIQLGADLASFFSRARGNKRVPVIMVPIENLQRVTGALPGTVKHREGKVLWGSPERAEKYI